MKKTLIALLFGSILVLAACGGGDDNAGEDTGNNDAGTEQQADENGDTGTDNAGDEGTADEGEGNVDTQAAEKIAQNNCATCHGADLTGQGNSADLTTIGSQYSKDEIVEIIQNGKGGMPPVNISDEDANTVASWLATKKE
ncbi:cytochrome c551 [Salinibacillus kushneri]|uniref:Cytochrome c551 n=1 Tax=Salinibacillus kushneri TaxID=237682 RepID=A0A1H9YPW3_9BACI|nr:cytochrome c [Salinibacillus kushneri]SES71086.1 cytochrome c551 [Salinibacillus kushneri]